MSGIYATGIQPVAKSERDHMNWYRRKQEQEKSKTVKRESFLDCLKKEMRSKK